MKFKVTVAGRSFDIEVDHDHLVWVDGQPMYAALQQLDGLPVYGLALDDAGYMLFIEDAQSSSTAQGKAGYEVEIRGNRLAVEVQPARPQLAAPQAECRDKGGRCTVVSAPLAGRLAALPVAVGDHVEADQVVAVVESMKMQIHLKAPSAGVVTAVSKPAGRDVERGDELVVLSL